MPSTPIVDIRNVSYQAGGKTILDGASWKIEQQKVLIARARMTRPMLIILDEPCAGFDPGARETFLSVLQELATTPCCPPLWCW